MKVYKHYINGAFVSASSGETFESTDPYTGEVWAKIARGDGADIDLAVAAARHAQDGEWAEFTARQRGKLLVRLAGLIEDNSAQLAEIEVRDNGKLLAEMSVQTKYMAEWYRYYGGLADKIEGAVIPTDKANIFNYTRYEPLGVIPFEDEEEAIEIANDVDFGLAAGVWTNDIGRSFRMSERLKVGTVWVNTYRAVSYTSPFGGYKRSGLGRESGLDAIYDYLQLKSVWVSTKTSTQNPFIIG